MTELVRQNAVLEGFVYDTESSNRCSAVMELNSTGRSVLRIAVSAQSERAIDFDLSECSVSDRIGHTPRFITHPKFGRFETSDNHTVDEVLRNARTGEGWIGKLAFGLESNLKAIVAMLIITVGCVFGFVRYGLPWGAEKVAQWMPESIVASIGSGSLDVLDQAVFSPSKLSEVQQEGWRERLQQPLSDRERALTTIVFRSSDEFGANAFALPDGTVLFTDDMLSMAKADEELQAILFHEIAHVDARHGMRRLIQQSGIGLIVLLVSGDVNAASQAAVLLPTLLVDAHYSRAMEREADDYALQRMLDTGIAPMHFVRIMRRLEELDQQLENEQQVDSDQEHRDQVISEYREWKAEQE